MRLHLPSSLRKSLLLAISTVAATLGSQTANASVLFDGVGIQTYADFGQNCGRFVAGEVNAMLKAIREKEEGIVIRYENGPWKDETYTITLDQGMIDFSSASSNPVDAAVGYGFLATVAHNGVLNPTYSALEVGEANAIRYSSIDFRRGDFHMEAATDYKVARLNKLVTDVQPSEFYSGDTSTLNGEYLYRTGSGAMDLGLIDGNANWIGTLEMDLPYTFATGGIVTIEWADNPTHKPEHDANFGIFHHVNTNIYTEITGKDFQTRKKVATPNPLPYRVRSGDSGSPTWVWNDEAGTYQYISAGQSGGSYFTQDRGDLEWSEYATTKFNVTANLGTSSGAHTITINPVTEKGDVIEGVGDTVEISTTPYSGFITYTDADGHEQNDEFIGIQQGKHTWKALNPIKDEDNWFNYGDAYFNVSKYKTEDKDFSYADLFVTNSLVFKAEDSSVYNVKLADDVDLGIGFVQFAKADSLETANFKLQSTHLLESAGFAIDKGVTLELDMKATEDRMVEWRKAGAGNLKITGSGNTNALLNVGGSGTVTLERIGGYAAYNVLASSGSTLVINDLKQVCRDVTLGAGGATLDLNGNNFVWNNSAEPDGNSFKSLHLLVEKDVVTNNKAGTTVTITIQDPGKEAFVGAFQDTAQSAIEVMYNGAEDKEWVMNTVFTKLQNEQSSFTVQQGSVRLEGINTVHGKQRQGKRGVNQFDWHYADAEMNVTVESGANFTLGSHARLTGDVTVKDGGSFTMTEYTTHQMEYIEGGVQKDNTYLYRKYFGLHGDVNLVGENSMFYVEFTPQHYYQDTDSESLYEERIYGEGGMVVDTAGGSLKLTNAENSFSGTKDLLGGKLVAEGVKALGTQGEGNTNKWRIHERGVLVVEGVNLADILPHVEGSYTEMEFGEEVEKYSNGVLALTKNEIGSVDLNAYQQLIIGAIGTIEFGERDTDNELAANAKNEWHLGGGGGNLYVNYRLNNNQGILVLGNEYTTGKVILTNKKNEISRIDLIGGVTLDYTDIDALGDASLSLQYGNRMMGDAKLIEHLDPSSDGVVLLDKMYSETVLDLTGHGDLSLAAEGKTEFSGRIILDATADTYHLGGGAGHLVLGSELSDGDEAGKVVARNVVVDGQFCMPIYGSQDVDGGVVELTSALKTTGCVTVRGYDPSRFEGKEFKYIYSHMSMVTLQLSATDALKGVGKVNLLGNGRIDINGTKQTLSSLINESPDEMAVIFDGSDKQTGELVLNVEKAKEDANWDVLFCNLLVPKLTKTGDGTLYMQNVTETSLFTIEEGKVVVLGHQALNSGGVTQVTGSGVLDISELDEDLEGKNILLREGGTLLVGKDAVDSTVLVDDVRGVIKQADSASSTTLSGFIGAEQNAILELNGKAFTLSGPTHNAAGGTINLNAENLSLKEDGGVFIYGTLNVIRDATMANASAAGASHTIDRLNVDGQTLTISNTNQAVQWDINALDGSGTVIMQPGSGASTMHLNGPGSFSGELRVQGGVDGTSGLVLAHDNAAQHATINLVNNGAMALKTANAHIGGLKGDASSKVFAYAQEAGEATLTTTGDQVCTYEGSIVDNEGTRLNLVHAGSGHQTYGGTLKVNNITVLDGELTVNALNLDLAGNVTVARGTALSVTSGDLTLDPLNFLRAEGGEGIAGRVNGNVFFNGGGMIFNATELASSGNTALNFQGSVSVADGESIFVNFTNTGALKAGDTLALAEGFSASDEKLISWGIDYLNANFSVVDNVLSVTFAQEGGYSIWDGTAEQHVWSAAKFGQQDTPPQTNEVAVFNDSANSKEVVLNGYIRVASLLFDNTSAYTVDTAAGFLSAANLDLQGGGTVTLGEHVNITEEVVIADGTLVLRGANTLASTATVEGDGKLVLDTSTLVSLDGKLSQIGSMEVRSGTLSSTETLHTNELLVGSHAELITNQGAILTEGGTVQSSGTVRIDVANSTSLTTEIAAGEDGTAGDLVKEGAGTLRVNSAVTANTVQVNAGRLEVDKAHLSGFLPSVKTVEVNAGASAYLGQNAQTTELPEIDTNFTVNGGTLQLALAQHATKVVTGELTITNGGTLKKEDGGLRFIGKATLGASAEDHVTLVGSWGKDGTIFDGVVEGAGHVKLQRGNNNVEQFTFNNAGNTFSGEIEATQGTTLVVGAQTALAKASGINLANTGTLMMADEKVDIKTLNGGGAISFSATETRTAATLNITDGGNFSGTVDAQISINKTGGGTLSLTGSSTQFSGALNILEGIVSLGSAAMDILNGTTSVFVDSDATLQLASAASVAGPMEIQGTLAMGGTISTRDSVQLGGDISVILGGEYEETVPGTRVYTVFSAAEGSTVTGWKNLSTANFSGIGSEARGVTFKELQVQDNKYQVVVSTENMRNMAITWSAEVAAGEWDVDKTSNFTEGGSGARTIYMEGDTVSIASKADITMAAAVSLDTLQVKSGADATIHQSAEHTLTMQTLDVQGGGRIAVNSLNTRFAGAANVAENGRLEISISSLGNSASVATLSGAGVVAFSNTASLDFGNNALAGGNVNASGFTGTIELGNGADTMRFRSTRVAGLDNRNTIELNDKAQFWMDNSNTAIASNLILHGNSGQSASSSWGGEGFGAVRGATEFNGSVAIDGNAMVSGASTITFNGAISGMGDDDTLTFGCYYSNQGAQEYYLAGENATELANMVVRKSGNNKTTVNVNRADGLADNVKFAVGTGENGIVNVNKSNTVERLDSASGDGVVNIAQNSALQLKQGADFGGSLKMAEGDVTVTAKAEGGTFQAGARVQFSTGSDGSAAISGNGSTRLDNANIQLQEQGSQLKMNDLVLGTMSMLKAASSAGVEANNLVIEGQEGVNVEARDAITIKSASVLRRMGDPTLSMLVEDESFACTFDITNVQGVELAGDCLTIDISSMYPELRVLSEEYTWLGISLGNGDHVSSLDSDMVVNLKLADNLICPAYYLSNVGTGGTKVALAQNGENVGMVFVALYAAPEPATSTLSLLALAALAARRRRKS